MTRTHDVAILGAGAAGMMCAAECARRGRRTVVIEHAKKPGEKIRISGGGRCNFTNLYVEPAAFLSANPRYAVSALSRYTQWDFIALMDDHGLPWSEKTLGQLFCETSARDVVEMLRAEMSGAELRLSTSIQRVADANGGYRIETSAGPVEAESLIVATGGKSIPKMGATGLAYDVAGQFGLKVTETRAGLVPFTLSPHLLDAFKSLTGVAAPVSARAGGAAFDEAMLFTHRGLSGPAMLQVSSYWREGEAVAVSFLPDAPGVLKAARAEAPRRALSTVLADHLPKALAAHLAAAAGDPPRMADLSDAALTRIAAQLTDWRVTPTGTEGYRTAEVTLGGVDTDGLDSRTMGAKAQPGLYFVGEAVDVTGWLGGYNFQWAWSSGWAAGQVA